MPLEDKSHAESGDNRDYMQLEIQPRSSWTNIRCPLLQRLTAPPKYVYFGYTRKTYTRKKSPGANPDQYMILEELEYLLRGDMNKSRDIRYNFLLGPDGRVYEGRGWEYAPRLPSKHYKNNLDSIYITYVGDFSDNAPSEDLFLLRRQFLRYAVYCGFIRKRFSMITLPDHYGYYLEPFSHTY